MMCEKILGYETCSMCGRLHRTAEMVPAHVPVLVGSGFELEEFIVCPNCFRHLTEVVCKLCAQFYYVTKEMLAADEEIRQVVASGFCLRCYERKHKR
jgi:hypothetical protein